MRGPDTHRLLRTLGVGLFLIALSGLPPVLLAAAGVLLIFASLEL
jgi:hypothetical protein